jgi:hypothetical protein
MPTGGNVLSPIGESEVKWFAMWEKEIFSSRVTELGMDRLAGF